MEFLIVIGILLFVGAAWGLETYAKTYQSPPKNYPSVEKSHSFHEPVGEYEDNHKDRVGTHLIKHPEPEMGYVVLNGIKRKIEDCKDL